MLGFNRKQKRAAKATGLRNGNAISQEYLQKCAQAGELQYKILQFQEELLKANDEIKALNQEYAALPADKKTVPAAPKAVEDANVPKA